MIQIYRIRLPRYFFLVGLVAAGVLGILLLNLRLAAAFGDDADFTSVTGANIFDLNDISFAETSVALNALPKSKVEGFAGEDLLGALLAGVPRSIFPIKPLSGSNQFTAIYDPVGWSLYGRGLTIGGINELSFDYTFPTSLIVVWIIGILAGFGLARVVRSKTNHGFAGLVAMYVMLYQFLKADLQSAGQVGSSFVVYFLAIQAFRPIGLLLFPPKTAIGRAGSRRPPRRFANPGQHLPKG